MVKDQNDLTEAVGGGNFLGQEIYYKDKRVGGTWVEPDTVGGKEPDTLNRNHLKAVVHAQPMTSESSAFHPTQSQIEGGTNSQFQIDNAQSSSPQANRQRERPSIPEIGSEVAVANPSSKPIELQGQEEQLPWGTKHLLWKGQTPAPKQAPLRRASTFKEAGIEHSLGSRSNTAAAEGVQHEGVVAPWFKKLFSYPLSRRYVLGSGSSPLVFPSRARLIILISLLALVSSCIWLSPSVRYPSVGRVTKQKEWKDMRIGKLARRGNSLTDTCTRWSHQSALVNGILYIYGGQSKREAKQSTDTWNNDFLTLSLTSNFNTASPALSGLTQPSGPPPVANGYLWHSNYSLFLYGGLFSDKPSTVPTSFSLWEYDVGSSSWKEHTNPTTSAGNGSDPGGQPVQRAAEGAGCSIPELGRGYFLGGHLDGYTTVGWSQSIPRVYLKSLLEFTFPGFQNDGIEELAGGKAAPSEGIWRNITRGGLQESAGFPERADGILVYISGFGKQGIAVGMAGGTNDTFNEMNIVDIYDIANSIWYKQATRGPTPGTRVNPCAVVASAADGSSFEIYMYGGQNLVPYGSQIQYNDMWILTVPSFTWINVSMSGQSNPPGRAGHTCDIWNAQMVVVGGYVGQSLSCDSPGIYVFDLSELTWSTSFTSLSGSNEGTPGQGSASRGYRVPRIVQSVIGGNSLGGATVTRPAVSPTAGPLQTGKPPTFTVTQPGITVTATATATGSGNSRPEDSGPNKAAIISSVLAVFCFFGAAYFAFCTWVYRRQLNRYKNHVALTQQASYEERPKKVVPGSWSPGGPATPSGRTSDAPPSSSGRYSSLAQQQGTPYQQVQGDAVSLAGSSTSDLMRGQEPSFLGVLLSPRRNLRVIND
ncbi:MAG: hypothetical protein M1840_004023 [Geoglossum simile]|nr:MAG: hypothetical protein M1840_004023 [Geoglossum simile]